MLNILVLTNKVNLHVTLLLLTQRITCMSFKWKKSLLFMNVHDIRFKREHWPQYDEVFQVGFQTSLSYF